MADNLEVKEVWVNGHPYVVCPNTKEIYMLLTKKTLNKILQDWRVSIPSELGNELLHEYGNFAIDDEGHVFEYTEQDIYEQLREKLRPYENHQQRGAKLS